MGNGEKGIDREIVKMKTNKQEYILPSIWIETNLIDIAYINMGQSPGSSEGVK